MLTPLLIAPVTGTTSATMGGHLFPSAEQDHNRLARAEAALLVRHEPYRLAATGQICLLLSG